MPRSDKGVLLGSLPRPTPFINNRPCNALIFFSKRYSEHATCFASINLLSLPTSVGSGEVRSVIFSVSQVEKLRHQHLSFLNFLQSSNEAKDANSGGKEHFSQHDQGCFLKCFTATLI